jgi:hypothetical protein
MRRADNHESPNAVNFDAALRMLRTRDFRAWRGLPADCTPARVAAELRRSDPNEGARQLGTNAIDVEWWPAEVAGYREPLEIQLANGMVVRIDGIGPDLAGGLRAHLEALGKPGAKLPYWDDETFINDGEWVWPPHGIAIYLGSDLRFARRVALFGTTDLAGYLRSLRPCLRSCEGR